jgi:NADP-dependent 3-hydroxy acid dehydrogenase YdfG
VIALDRDASGFADLTGLNPGRLCTLCLDVTDAEAIAALPDSLPEGWREVDVLVNCAGHDIGGRRPFLSGEPDKYAAIIETNVVGVIRVTHALAGGMAERGRGHIVNLGSISGLRTSATMATYAASKHAIRGFTDCLRQDLTGSGVRVTEVAAGRVRTNFGYARAESKEEGDKFYDEVGECLSAEDVADAVLFALERPPHVVVSHMLLMPASQA